MRFFTLLIVIMACAACAPVKTAKPDYGKPAPFGWGLFRVCDRGRWPDIAVAFEGRDQAMLDALDRSLKWFDIESSKKAFQIGDVTHLRAQASIWALRKILTESKNATEFDVAISNNFYCYTSWGYDRWGTVLYTGYYSPVFNASAKRTSVYQYPIYKRPADLISDPKTGEVKGQQTSSGLKPYPTRSELESGNMLVGQELFWVASRMDQYIIHVNGSAKLELSDGRVTYIGYAGTNGHKYTGLGHTLIQEGVLPPEGLSLPAIRAYFANKPDLLEKYINMNDRFVFFREYDGNNWPAGSLGFKVAAKRSLATDKEIFPRAGLVLVDTQLTPGKDRKEPFSQFLFDQDTGGGIRAPGRADIFMGVGPEAEAYAGGQFADGGLFYFFLKHENTLEWVRRMRAERNGSPELRPAQAAPARNEPPLK